MGSGRSGNQSGKAARHFHKKRYRKGTGNQPDCMWTTIKEDNRKKTNRAGRQRQKYPLPYFGVIEFDRRGYPENVM